MPRLARPLLHVLALPAEACTEPADWTITREAGNPLIGIPAGETTEQYAPGAVRLPTGEIWLYVKGASRVYAWRSTDDGATFTIQNGGAAVLAPVAATWESSFVLEAAAVYDDATDTIHLYYKGRDGDTSKWQWGHATAPGTDPTAITRDPANPIFTKADALADLSKASQEDFGISDVLVVGGTYHFFGYGSWNGRYQLVHATGTDWNNPTDLTSLIPAENDSRVVTFPTVFSLHTKWIMLYTRGNPQPGLRDLEAATAVGGLSVWNFDDMTPILSPTGTGWEELEAYAGSLLKDKAGIPIDVDGKWLLFYSGLDDSSVARTGLARIDNPC